jgi:septal ring factor EnvC (AmiA/AmiB activator)
MQKEMNRDATSVGENVKYPVSLSVRLGVWLLAELDAIDIKNIAGAVKKQLKKQLDPIEKKIDSIQQRVDDVDSRLKKIEQGIAAMKGK